VSDALGRAQEWLASTLERALAEQDRDFTKRVREEATALAGCFNGLLRMARTHSLDNLAFEAPTAELAHRLAALIQLVGPIHLLTVEDQVYVNDLRIRFETLVEQAFSLGEDLHRHNIGGVSFNAPLSRSQAHDLVRLLTAPPAAQRPRTTLQLALGAAGMKSVELHPVVRFKVSDSEALAVSTDLRDLCREIALVLAEAFGNVATNRLPEPLKARRVVVRLIDLLDDTPGATHVWQMEPLLPDFSLHTVMVTNLALMLGRSVALPRQALADLGVAAMFHDLGFCLGPDGPMVSFDRHARAGLGVLLRQRGFHRAKVRRLLAVLTHHRDLDGETGPPPLYSRIIHIADDFDILTRPRARAVGPAEALARMAAHAGKAYDAALLQGFINALGAYPPGTKLRLADGRAVVSVSAVRGPATFDRPLCRAVGGSGGGPVELSTLAPVQGVLPGTGGVTE
jgi:hypothetical protein